jgi:signal transduction histidine kinase
MSSIPHVPAPGYGDEKRRQMLGYLKIDALTIALLEQIAPVVEEHMDSIVANFYDYLTSFETTRNVFRDAAQVERLKESQKVYLRQALTGPYDEDYFQRRWRIGYIHNVISLEPQWFIGAFQLYHRLLFPLIMERFHDDPRTGLEAVQALDKIMMLDMNLGLESYWAHYIATMNQLHELNVQIKEASEAKSQFLANMSHEFRTPLNAIIGFTEVLQDNIAGPLNAEQTDYLQEIHDAGKMLLRLVNDVLDIAKVEAGRLELFAQEFSIAQLIRKSVTTIKGLAEKKGLWLEMKLPPDLGVISADPLRVQQILNNLLVNAVKFTDAGGVTISASTENNELHVCVEDTGIGIRPEHREIIFDEFQQIEATQGERKEGTGLGLALSKLLTEAHGGRIWVESEFGKGSAFHVTLPLRAPRVKDAKGGG